MIIKFKDVAKVLRHNSYIIWILSDYDCSRLITCSYSPSWGFYVDSDFEVVIYNDDDLEDLFVVNGYDTLNNKIIKGEVIKNA